MLCGIDDFGAPGVNVGTLFPAVGGQENEMAAD